jgi:hypothetical protein
METTEHQEWRSRQQLSIPAAIKAGLFCGVLFFIMSGGSPWSTAGTMNMIMGRDIPIASEASRFWSLAFWHHALSLLYSFAIGFVVYRFRTPAAIPLGLLTGMALYGLNVFLFRALGLTMQSPEFVTWFVHLNFSLFATLIYKAMSVPKPLPA